MAIRGHSNIVHTLKGEGIVKNTAEKCAGESAKIVRT